MLKSFFSRPNIFVRLLVVLVFAGGLVFAATYDGFTPKTQAEDSSCCGGTDAAPTDEPIAQTEANGCCGSTTDVAPTDEPVAQAEVSGCCGGETDIVPADDGPVSDDDPCSCGAEKCDTSNCAPEDCTVKKCPTGCLEPGESCTCVSRCNDYACNAECTPYTST